MELETYDAGSIAVGNGVLSISAQRAGASFSSGRITSAGKKGFAPSPGETLRVEARIQLPQGVHTVPAPMLTKPSTIRKPFRDAPACCGHHSRPVCKTCHVERKKQHSRCLNTSPCRRTTCCIVCTWEDVDYEPPKFVPGGDRIWPAFWMLPTAYDNGSLPYGVWPRSGEIDVMESVNAFVQVFGTIHCGLPQQQLGAALSQGASTGVFAGAMHVYAVGWSQDQIIW